VLEGVAEVELVDDRVRGDEGVELPDVVVNVAVAGQVDRDPTVGGRLVPISSLERIRRLTDILPREDTHGASRLLLSSK
jgi:hypothetical protein